MNDLEFNLIGDPIRFGPRLWPIIHMQAKRMDHLLKIRQKNDNEAYVKHTHILYQFFDNLNTFIPCVNCSTNFLTFKTKQPLPSIDLKKYQDDSFWKWSVDLHNHANKITKKREFTYTEANQQFYKQWLGEYKEEDILDFINKRQEDHQKIVDMQEQLKNAGVYYHIPEYGYIIIISSLMILILLLIAFRLSKLM